MIDSARVRTVGSSSTTRTVVGLACFDVIRTTPVGFKSGNRGAKAKFRLSQLFHLSISSVALMQQKLRFRKQRPATWNAQGLIIGTVPPISSGADPPRNQSAP